MPVKIVILSGRVCAGKSTLARRLQDDLAAEVVSSKELIAAMAPTPPQSRADFQTAGDELDRRDNGKWIADAVVGRLSMCKPNTTLLVLDSVRISEQLSALRAKFGAMLTHVHLTAGKSELDSRYRDRVSDTAEFDTYHQLEEHSKTEQGVERLSDLADVVIETDKCGPEDVYARVSARIGVRPGTADPCVDVIVGGQYGSEGKGNIVHYLAREYDVLVRVGGPNAGHKVFTEQSSKYTFHQLPSGAIANKTAKLVIGAGAVIRLDTLLKEIKDLEIASDRLIIDPQAMMIDERDVAWEQGTLKEAMGSTASGAGHATARKILSRDPEDPPVLAGNVAALAPFIQDSVDYFSESLASGRKIMLEGTQGTSLSIHHGQYPHVTSRVTTATGCLAEAGLSSRHVRKIVMVCRSLPIRVGNSDSGMTSGEMRREIDLAEVARRSGIAVEELQTQERTSTTNRKRRIAEFDWSQFNRSIVLNGPTDIALTFADYINVKNRDAYRYEQLDGATLRFIEELEKVGGIPVSLISTAFSHRNIIDRRAW